MNYKTIFILTFCNSFLFNQEIIGEGLYADELINYLNQNYKTNSVLSYSNARDVLYSEVDNNDVDTLNALKVCQQSIEKILAKNNTNKNQQQLLQRKKFRTPNPHHH